MNKPIQIILDSRYRTSGTLEKAVYDLRNNIWGRCKGEMRVDWFQKPITEYVFRASDNNTIPFTETAGGGKTTATITAGSYTAAALETEIKTRMDAASANTQTYTVSISDTTKKITISTSANVTLHFGDSGTAFYELGFANSDTSASTSHTAAGVIHLEGYSLYRLRCLEMNIQSISETGLNGKYDNQEVIATIPTGAAGFGDYLLWENPDRKWYRIPVDKISKLTIMLTKPGSGYDLIDANGGDYIMQISLRAV